MTPFAISFIVTLHYTHVDGKNVTRVCVCVCCVQSGDASFIRSGPEETLLSHKLVFEAERARLESKVVFCGTDQD